jgi:hypothetical protein
MQALGFECAEIDDPYAAVAELYRRPLVYRALVLSLAGLFKEELPLVGSLKKRLPHIEVWLTHIEGRQAAMAEAMRQGADGLLDEDGVLHRMAVKGGEAVPPLAGVADEDAPPPEEVQALTHPIPDAPTEGEPLLSADELRALLAEHPAIEGEGNP